MAYPTKVMLLNPPPDPTKIVVEWKLQVMTLAGTGEALRPTSGQVWPRN